MIDILREKYINLHMKLLSKLPDNLKLLTLLNLGSQETASTTINKNVNEVLMGLAKNQPYEEKLQEVYEKESNKSKEEKAKEEKLEQESIDLFIDQISQ